MVWPAIIAAGASLAGGIIGNNAKASQASKDRDWQAHMYATRYQQTMPDMKAAGLNPILAYQNGVGNVPSGSTAQQSDVISPAVNSAMSAMRLKEELNNLKETNANIREDTRKKSWEAKLNENLVYNAKQSHHEIEERWRALRFDNKKRAAEAKVYDSKYGNALRALGIVRDNLGGLIPFTRGGNSARTNR